MRRRSRGIYEFATKPTGFGKLASKIRLLNEQGRINELHMDTDVTMVCARGGEYSEELYKISCRVFGPIGSSVWDRDYALKRDIELSDIKIPFMKQMYERVVDYGVDMSDYISLQMKTDTIIDTIDYVKRVFESSGRQSVPAWTFLVREDYGRYTIFMRKAFLELFKTGRDILNYARSLRRAEQEKELEKRKKDYNYHYKRSKL